MQTQSLFSNEGWYLVTFIAGEVKQPKRNVPLALLIGTLSICLLCVAIHMVYLKVLGASGIAGAPQDRVGSQALKVLLGPVGETLMAGAILWSMFGCLNGLLISGARVHQTMAKDGLFLRSASGLNSKGVPLKAMGLQAIWASLLTLSGSYYQLLDFVMFASLLFYVLTVAGVIILRIRRPDAERLVKTPGYPIVPLIYLVGALAVMVTLLLYRPAFTWPGLGIVALGYFVYLVIQSRQPKAEEEGNEELAQEP